MMISRTSRTRLESLVGFFRELESLVGLFFGIPPGSGWLFAVALILFLALLFLGWLQSESGRHVAERVLATLRSFGFSLFALAFGYLVSLAFMWFLEKYLPRGATRDTAHIWVLEGTRNKVRDATERDVYEHYHGHGSWWKKVESEWKAIRFIGFLLACFGPLAAAHFLGLRPDLFGSGSESVKSAVGILAAGSIYVVIQKLWDVDFAPPRERPLSYEEQRISQQVLSDLMVKDITRPNSGWALLLGGVLLVWVVQPLCAVVLFTHYLLSPTWQVKTQAVHLASLVVFSTITAGLYVFKKGWLGT